MRDEMRGVLERQSSFRFFVFYLKTKKIAINNNYTNKLISFDCFFEQVCFLLVYIKCELVVVVLTQN